MRPAYVFANAAANMRPVPTSGRKPDTRSHSSGNLRQYCVPSYTDAPVTTSMTGYGNSRRTPLDRHYRRDHTPGDVIGLATRPINRTSGVSNHSAGADLGPEL